MRGLPLHTVQVYEADVNILPSERGEILAVVHARGVNGAAVHPRFVEIIFRMVEAAEVVDHRHHKLQREVGFEVEALKTLYGEAGGMGFAKGITGKTLYLPPYLLRQLIRVAAGAAIIEVLPAEAFQGVALVLLARHDAAQHIALVQPQAGEMMDDLHYVFLIDHHPEGLAQLLFEYGVQIPEAVRMVKTLNVLPHHARLGHSRPDDGTGRHQMQIVVAPQLLK